MRLQITIDGKTYAAEVQVIEEDSIEDLSDDESGAPIPHTLPPGAYSPTHAGETHSADEKVYHSPVMGLVIKVNVGPGQAVRAGDVIAVLEAMKMETSVTAHHAGTVKSVAIKAGDSVKLHQALVEME